MLSVLSQNNIYLKYNASSLQSSSTMMSLKQTGIPASEFDAMKTNWYRYYWHSIKQTFGFGTSISDAL